MCAYGHVMYATSLHIRYISCTPKKSSLRIFVFVTVSCAAFVLAVPVLILYTADIQRGVRFETRSANAMENRRIEFFDDPAKNVSSTQSS